jgi:hypothetical protein
MNIFSRTPAATPVEEVVQAVNVQPVVEEKKSITEAVKGFFTRSRDAVGSMQSHQDNIVRMLKKSTSQSEFLVQQIPLTLENASVRDVLQYHHDLNNRPVLEAVKTDSFITLKNLIKPSRLTNLLREGYSIISTQKGGIDHATKILDQTLLDAAQRGVNKALQGRVLTDADKQSFLDESVHSLETSLNDGSISPEQAIVNAQKLAADPVLGPQLPQGKAGAKLDKVVAQAKQQILDTEKNVVMEAIDGNFQVQNEKMDKITSLFERLSALQGKNDSSVEASSAVHQEVQEITSEIIGLVKELDDASEISAAHIENPTSRNINKQQRKELETLLTHDLDKAELILKKKAQEINEPLVTKLQDIQAQRSLARKAYDGVFNRGSLENAILAKSAKTDARISTLTSNISKYEAALAAKAAAAAARTWGQFGSDLASRLNPFKAAAPSLESEFNAAEAELNEFLADETVQNVFAEYEKLVTDLDNVTKKFFLIPSNKKAAIEKATGQVTEYVMSNEAIFRDHEALVVKKADAETAYAKSLEEAQATEAQEEDFVVV